MINIYQQSGAFFIGTVMINETAKWLPVSPLFKGMKHRKENETTVFYFEKFKGTRT